LRDYMVVRIPAASSRAKRSNPSRRTEGWIASSPRSRAQTLRVCRRQ
jgi:hypothetical protein